MCVILLCYCDASENNLKAVQFITFERLEQFDETYFDYKHFTHKELNLQHLARGHWFYYVKDCFIFSKFYKCDPLQQNKEQVLFSIN